MKGKGKGRRGCLRRSGTVRTGWLLALLSLLPACAGTAPEQALREAVAGMQSAIEARDASSLQSYLADDFVGPDGLDRNGARRLAAAYLMRHDRVGVIVGPLEIRLQERHASVAFTATLTGGARQQMPDAARVYAVQTGWRLEASEWKLTSAAWEPMF